MRKFTCKNAYHPLQHHIHCSNNQRIYSWLNIYQVELSFMENKTVFADKWKQREGNNAIQWSEFVASFSSYALIDWTQQYHDQTLRQILM